MSDENQRGTATCAVCERRLLPGEQPSPFVTTAGTEVEICELCKGRAEAAGWLRPEQAAAGSAPDSRRGRRERPPILGGLIGGRERAGGRRSGARQRPEAEQSDREAGSPGAERGAESEPAQADPADPGSAAADTQSRPVHSAAGPDLAEAISAFNESEHRRTIAGLSRSLGAPRATAIAVRTHAGATGARLTVAWDLAWYQWEVGPGGHRPEIRQIGKGDTLDQLRAADRNWNVEVGEDGALRSRPAGR